LAYFRNMQSQGWSAEAWAPNALPTWATPENSACNADRFPEEFWNCADISIARGGEPSRTATTDAPGTPAPTTSSHGNTEEDSCTDSEHDPYSSGQEVQCCDGLQRCIGDWSGNGNWHFLCKASCDAQSSTTPVAAAPAPTPSAGSSTAAQKWGQCGGSDYDGPTQCEAGCVCKEESEWYSQCIPSDISSSATPVASIVASTSTPAPSGSEADAWDKCGGNGWDGPTECVTGYICRVQDEWYSQCVPNSSLSFLGRKHSVVRAHRPLQQ